jgi:DNA-binding response OmpR family regulator
MAKILIADDDPFILQFIEKILRSSEHDPILAHNGQEALSRFSESTPELVLLDVMMPSVSGLDVCRQIRSTHPLIPILLLTARQQIENKVEGLACGADDYITKPFDRQELLARIQAALRRTQAWENHQTEAQNSEKIQVNGLNLDLQNWKTEYRHTPIKLSRTEFKLLRTFCENPDQVLNRQYLMNTVWNYEFSGTTRTVDNFIMRLRKKLQGVVSAHGHQFPALETLYGIGYRLTSRAPRTCPEKKTSSVPE